MNEECISAEYNEAEFSFQIPNGPLLIFNSQYELNMYIEARNESFLFVGVPSAYHLGGYDA